MIKSTLYLYSPAFARTIVYMLQSVEYKTGAYLKWFWRTKDFRMVVYRKDLTLTRPARLLRVFMLAGMAVEVILAIYLIAHGIATDKASIISYGIAVLIITPLLWSHLVILPLLAGDILIIRPHYGRKIRRSTDVFKKHQAVKIAIAGSYGKTTMKEILLAVLSQGKKVAATPANKNVSISHALFAGRLHGDEDILLIEYGEGAPGDVGRFAKRTHPDVGIITGLAPAHLDRYKTLENAGRDIFSLGGYVSDLYVNSDAESVQPFLKPDYKQFDSKGIGNWKVSAVKVAPDSLSFALKMDKAKMAVKSRLIGRHLIAPLVLAVYLAKQNGLTDAQIKKGIEQLEPFEHRMKPYQLSGAWVIDDTYNGNIEGMKAGLALLKELKAKRKIYVTPGLVDQGEEEAKIHRELGQAITAASPDKVILMQHSVTDHILDGMKDYKGEVVIENDPLQFYLNLDKSVAAGDLVLMQNDWPDQYI
jgi:UDP-N-acetylmuramoyl-tripeptide--D-alanyl-D-alanine ligase